jgi:hypothetical protein
MDQNEGLMILSENVSEDELRRICDMGDYGIPLCCVEQKDYYFPSACRTLEGKMIESA